LKSRQFEREVIIANNLQKVYFDIDHAIEIFMERERKKDWNDEETQNDLFYMELEKELFGDGSRGGDIVRLRTYVYVSSGVATVLFARIHI
jgi:hypothetical protein